jgi:protein SSD1
MQQRNQQRSTPALQANPTSRVATQRISIRDMPVYEEEAVDDRNELPSPGSNHPQLAPNFQFGTSRRQSNSNIANLGLDDAISALGLNSTNGLQNSPHAFNLPSSNGGGGSASGINATVLAGIAARANQRHQPEYNPVMEQQLMLQRQIEMLQEQQRVLMQQNNMLQQGLGGSNISALSQALLSQQAQQSHVSTEDNARLLQEQYIKVLTAQSLAQSQQLALHQAQALAQTQNQSNTGYHQRELSRASRSGLNDFVLPSLGATLARPASASNDTSGRNRAGPEMGPPAANLSGHRRRNSVQTHRPQNSIIGSFGGFVADMPDDAVMAHHRAHSRSATGDWRNVGPSKEAVLDLASAQAQLQMLSNFRSNQIGGGGHSKMASFSFPNMLPNLMMASTMGPATQSIVQQQQAFQMQLQQHQGPGPQRKSLFAPYLPQGSLPALLAAGKLVVGVLRVNKRNRSDAYVATDVLDADIYICGSKDRNRALEGDIVAVELLDVDEVWGSKKEKEEKKRKKEENSTFDQGINKLNARKNDKKKDDVEVEGQGMVLFDDEEVTDEQKPTYAGHVVAVVERMTGQLFSGQLGVLRPSSAATKEKQEAERRERGGEDAEVEPVRKGSDRPKIVWFKPTDKRVPLIAIPTEQAPSDFIEHSEAYSNKLFVATIKRWPITSLHPFGALVDELGSIGDLEVETSALLKDCNFPTEDFQDATLRCLPPMPWSIPEREYEIRRDMRDARVFTIDPATARDLDDALSIKHNEDGTFEVGVHIADVSHFVRPNTALDRDARKRATSVYLVQRAVPMLPPLLSEQLCSLVPGVERLTFSAFFTLDPEGNILSKTFSKTIIKSCVKLAYDEAQGVLDGGKLDKEIQPGHRAEDIEEDIKNLNSIAVNLRNRRFKDGALRIEQPKLAFVIDEFGKPTDVRPYERMASHELIEEFMLLANMAVAAVIANGLPEQALLRRHEAPIARRVDAFIERAKRLGFDFAGVGSSEMQAGFEHIENYGDKLCLQILATRAMTRYTS